MDSTTVLRPGLRVLAWLLAWTGPPRPIARGRPRFIGQSLFSSGFHRQRLLPTAGLGLVGWATSLDLRAPWARRYVLLATWALAAGPELVPTVKLNKFKRINIVDCSLIRWARVSSLVRARLACRTYDVQRVLE